jgi:hypothetical protein
MTACALGPEPARWVVPYGAAPRSPDRLEVGDLKPRQRTHEGQRHEEVAAHSRRHVAPRVAARLLHGPTKSTAAGTGAPAPRVLERVSCIPAAFEDLPVREPGRATNVL